MTATPAPLPMLLAALFAAAPLLAQDRPETFPAKRWKAVKLKPEKRKRLNHSKMTTLTPKNVFELTFEGPEDWPETVVTDGDGKVLARGTQTAFSFPDREVGDRYRIYVCKPKQRRYLLWEESFVEYSGRNFPGKRWQARKDARLVLQKVRQFTPKTMAQSFAEPHSVSFRLPKRKRGAPVVVYLLARLDRDGKEREEDQSLGGKLEFWGHAKAGETFRIYELHPADHTYRATATMTVEKDYPLGR